MTKLTNLVVYNCSIDSDQAYLVSNDKLENCKTVFKLRKFNISCNKLNNFISYLIEFDLINNDIRKLSLINCELTDE